MDPVRNASILELLRRNDPEAQCAAIIVLGRTRPDPETTIPVLLECLRSAEKILKPYILDALARFEVDDALEPLVPYLEHRGALREQAIQIFSKKGERALPLLRRHTLDEEPQTQAALARVLTSIGTEPSLSWAFELLKTRSIEVARAVVATIKKTLHKNTATQRDILATLALRKLRSLDPGSDPIQEVALLKVLTYLECPSATELSLARADVNLPKPVCAAALHALSRIPLDDASGDDVGDLLRPHLGPEHHEGTTRRALRVLRRFNPLPIREEDLLELTHSPSPHVVRAAIRELPRIPGPGTNDRLLELLKHSDVTIRGSATRALGRSTHDH